MRIILKTKNKGAAEDKIKWLHAYKALQIERVRKPKQQVGKMWVPALFIIYTEYGSLKIGFRKPSVK